MPQTLNQHMCPFKGKQLPWNKCIYLITTTGYTIDKRLRCCSYCILLDITMCWYTTDWIHCIS